VVGADHSGSDDTDTELTRAHALCFLLAVN
jgi:hypothetical protein